MEARSQRMGGWRVCGGAGRGEGFIHTAEKLVLWQWTRIAIPWGHAASLTASHHGTTGACCILYGNCITELERGSGNVSCALSRGNRWVVRPAADVETCR